jgi:hypothetical protein
MKRRRPTPRPLAILEANLWGGEVIPPGSVVALKGSRKFRIGYYSPKDGLNCVWLVNSEGKYEQTVDQRMIRRSFEVLTRSDEADFYGKDRPVLEALTGSL